MDYLLDLTLGSLCTHPGSHAGTGQLSLIELDNMVDQCVGNVGDVELHPT